MKSGHTLACMCQQCARTPSCVFNNEGSLLQHKWQTCEKSSHGTFEVNHLPFGATYVFSTHNISFNETMICFLWNSSFGIGFEYFAQASKMWNKNAAWNPWAEDSSESVQGILCLRSKDQWTGCILPTIMPTCSGPPPWSDYFPPRSWGVQNASQ